MARSLGAWARRATLRVRTAFDGVGQGSADDLVDLEHHLGCIGAFAVGRVEHPVVERFELLGAQAPDRDGAECGHDVQPDLAGVAGPRAVLQFVPLGRQPPVGEVCPEAQRADLVVGPGAFGGKAGGEVLGVAPVCAGGVPAAPGRGR
jgi:hypothetical protein